MTKFFYLMLNRFNLYPPENLKSILRIIATFCLIKLVTACECSFYRKRDKFQNHFLFSLLGKQSIYHDLQGKKMKKHKK